MPGKLEPQVKVQVRNNKHVTDGYSLPLHQSQEYVPLQTLNNNLVPIREKKLQLVSIYYIVLFHLIRLPLALMSQYSTDQLTICFLPVSYHTDWLPHKCNILYLFPQYLSQKSRLQPISPFWSQSSWRYIISVRRLRNKRRY